MSEAGEQTPLLKTPQGAEKTQVPEVPHYSADHLLTKEEIGREADRLIGEFVNVFRDDPDVQAAIAKDFFDYDNYREGTIHFNKANAGYTVNTLSSRIPEEAGGNHMRVERHEGDDLEYLTLTGGEIKLDGYAGERLRAHSKTRIEYRHFNKGHDVTTVGGEWEPTTGIAVDASRSLLEKAKRDFGKT